MPHSSYGGILSVRGSNSGLLFQWESGISLSKSSFVKHVRAVLEEVGLPAKDYAGHSFRIGAQLLQLWLA